MSAPSVTLAVDATALAELVAAEVERALAVRRTDAASPWLSAQEAADYMKCPLSRIRRLTMQRALPVHRDGTRVLYLRDELDAFIHGGGATSC